LAGLAGLARKIQTRFSPKLCVLGVSVVKMSKEQQAVGSKLKAVGSGQQEIRTED
jgi:hypothetical protein